MASSTAGVDPGSEKTSLPRATPPTARLSIAAAPISSNDRARNNSPNPSSGLSWKGFPGSLRSPDSILFRPKDMKDFFQHIAWFLGIKKAPEFDRWGYWEKFDYFAVFWGMIILGVTGLLMAYPLASSRIMPGWGLNVAFWVHRIEALLAMAHLFVIHFFIAHLRRHNFPMDEAMFQGSADLEATRHERPAWITRLKQNGQLDGALVAEAMPAQRVIYYVFGFAAVAVGLFLLIGALLNVRYISW